MYPESNKILFNFMYDKYHKAFFKMSDQCCPGYDQAFWWDGAEPLWITAVRNNISTASLQWQGGHISYNGIKPKIATPFIFNNSMIPNDFETDLKTAIELLASDEVQYAQVYTEYTDFWAHAFGPGLMENYFIPTFIDPLINQLLLDIELNQLENSLNVVILSDHGMTATGYIDVQQRYLSDVLVVDDVDYMLDRGSHMSFYPAEGKLDKVYNDLKKLDCVTVYKMDEIPKSFHINYPARLPPIFLQVKRGYYLHPINDPKKQIGSDQLQEKNIQLKLGFHGYIADDFPDMWGIFMARGPAFKKGVVVPHFKTIDAYNMLAHLLGIPPNPNNGSWDLVKGMLL